MDEEKKHKAGSKRRTKQADICFDASDNEPIGSFIKLKTKSKKNKINSCGGDDKGVGNSVAPDEELFGMDDTLASLRKKLRGPKKGGGRISKAGIDVGSKVAEPFVQSVNEPEENRDSTTWASEKGLLEGSNECTVGLDKGLGGMARSKNKRSNNSPLLRDIGTEHHSVDAIDNQACDKNLLLVEHAVDLEPGQGLQKLLDDGFEDSLSTFFQKAQSVSVRKSRFSTRLKPGNEALISSGGMIDSSDGVTAASLLEPSRNYLSDSKIVTSVSDHNENVYLTSCTGMEDSLVKHENTGVLPWKFSSCNLSEEELVLAQVAPQETVRSNQVGDVSEEELLEDSNTFSTYTSTKPGFGTCSNSSTGVESDGLIGQTSLIPLPDCHSVETASPVLNLEMPLSLIAKEYDNSHCDVSLPEKASDNVISPVHAIKEESMMDVDQKVLTLGCEEALKICPDHKHSSLQCFQSLCSSRNMSAETVDSSQPLPLGSAFPVEKAWLAETVHHKLDSDMSIPNHGQFEGGLDVEVVKLTEEYSIGDADAPDTLPKKLAECQSNASIFPEKEDLAPLHSSLSPVSCAVAEHENTIQEEHHSKLISGQLEETNLFAESAALKDCATESENACLLGFDSLSGDEEARKASSPSDTTDCNGSYSGDASLMLDNEETTVKQSVGQRAGRKHKKRRDSDMAYEGDADWEILSHEQEFFVGHRIGDSDKSSKTRAKLNSFNLIEAENGGSAAVAAGLKAHSLTPIEKIRFKEVIKRKGGIQEYLECRNFILSLWSKDVSRILPLSECLVSNARLAGESPCASLIGDIYAFLDQCGYINFCVASAKDVNGVAQDLRPLKAENFEERLVAPDGNPGDVVSFNLGNSKTLENSSVENHCNESDDAKLVSNLANGLVDVQIPALCMQTESIRFTSDNNLESCFHDANVPGDVSVDNADIDGELSTKPSEALKVSSDLQSALSKDKIHSRLCNFDATKKIIVVGAGPAGLTAARHLQRQGFHVTVLEARSRIGGRVFTDHSSLSVPVDLGASIITGVEADVATERRADPSSLVCAQLGLELTVLNSDCPLYDTATGQKVPADLDETLEAEFNSLLDDMLLLVAQRGEHASQMSLEDGLEYALKRRVLVRNGKYNFNGGPFKSTDTVIVSEKETMKQRTIEDLGVKTELLSPVERRVMDWHFANLEYGCAALLKEVSLPNWNQDDVYGGFGGAHCMIKGGYSAVVESLANGLSIQLNHVVKEIKYLSKDDMDSDDQREKVIVSTLNGHEFSGDAVLITVPLGCLKAESIQFSPSLPEWKCLSIQRLGFGVLNKVVMEFPDVFWDDSIDYFGATAEETHQRGWCFMFWNVKKTVGAPVLIALVVGKAAIDGQHMSSCDHVNHALVVLRKLFGETNVPEPVASVVTDWGMDPYSYGAYSYVAVGSSGEDYDLLGRPVENCLFFAGEATCKEHPDTVGGAMMSGLREAVRIIDVLNTGIDYTAEIEAMEAAKSLDVERIELNDIIRRLDAIELSSALNKKSLDRIEISTREHLLKDMFNTTKSTAGRLFVVKELLKLPVDTLKSFAGTKQGLSRLNSWMLDAMGKDGTQLLRHCVRLLVLVSTDLLAVRLSGIGKTMKEKVCVHSSRDIRAVASQLVSVWIEIFRKEKASNGGLKSLNKPTSGDYSKSKSAQTSGRPPLRTYHVTADGKGSANVSSYRNPLTSSYNMKKSFHKSVNVEAKTDSKSDVKPLTSYGSEEESAMTEEEKAALAAAEAAHAAAVHAAEAYASSGINDSTSLQLPKIPSFLKFARREQYARIDETDISKNWIGGVLKKQDGLSEIDSRNCRVRDWSVDFSAAGMKFEKSKMSADNLSRKSHSNDTACQSNYKEHSGENLSVDSTLFTKAWVDSGGSEGLKDYNAIERWQSQAAAANSDYFQTANVMDEADSDTTARLSTWNPDTRANESSASQVTVNKELLGNQPRGAECIKQAVVDYCASLLMPLYKARKIDRGSYKLIMKKTATKVMEHTSDAEKAMAVFEFLDSKRKNKIRAFVDQLIERHMGSKTSAKS